MMRRWGCAGVGSGSAMTAAALVQLVVACSAFSEEAGGADGAAADGGAAEGGASSDAAGLSCNPPDCVVLATSEQGAASIFVDATAVYWALERKGGTIRRVSKTGGAGATTAAVSVNDLAPAAPIVASSFIYFVANDNVRVSDLASTDSARAATAGGQPPTSVQRVDSFLYFSAGATVRRCPLQGGATNGKVCMDPNVAGMPVATTNGTFGKLAQAPDLAALWFYDGAQIWRIGGTGSNGTVVFDQPGLRALAADKDAIYFIRDNGVFALGTNEARMAKPTTLATEPQSPTAIAFDPTHVYFTVREGNRIMKVARVGGAPATVLARLEAPTSIAVNDGHAYVVLANGSIVSIATSPAR